VKLFGRELWADLVVRAEVLRDGEAIRASLRAGAEALGCEVLSEHHQEFEPSGLTAVVIIGESHLIASTYEELGVLAVNIQTCTGRMDLVPGLEAICDFVGAERARSLLVMRRLDTPFEVELSGENVPFRDGRLRFDGSPDAGYGFSASKAIK
jgi:S-adenosylmethionine decarboxylase